MLATSSGMQGCVRRLEWVAMAPIMSASMSAAVVPATIGVTIVPGQMALQRMPSAWKRRAVCLVTPMTAALVET